MLAAVIEGDDYDWLRSYFPVFMRIESLETNGNDVCLRKHLICARLTVVGGAPNRGHRKISGGGAGYDERKER